MRGPYRPQDPLHDGTHFAQYSQEDINKWNALVISYEEFQVKSDAELYMLFCIPDEDTPPNPRRDELESLLPSICKELGKRGMITLKQYKDNRIQMAINANL